MSVILLITILSLSSVLSCDIFNDVAYCDNLCDVSSSESTNLKIKQVRVNGQEFGADVDLACLSYFPHTLVRISIHPKEIKELFSIAIQTEIHSKENSLRVIKLSNIIFSTY